jgi:hypothetical protein
MHVLGRKQEVAMSQPVRARVAVAGVIAALALISGAILKAQIGVTPYKVNYNWDKLEGRKIGVASGIRLDPDGQHLWILDRCARTDAPNPPSTPSSRSTWRASSYGVSGRAS